jgi:hypothetical protein
MLILVPFIPWHGGQPFCSWVCIFHTHTVAISLISIVNRVCNLAAVVWSDSEKMRFIHSVFADE